MMTLHGGLTKRMCFISLVSFFIWCFESLLYVYVYTHYDLFGDLKLTEYRVCSYKTSDF